MVVPHRSMRHLPEGCNGRTQYLPCQLVRCTTLAHILRVLNAVEFENDGFNLQRTAKRTLRRRSYLVVFSLRLILILQLGAKRTFAALQPD